MNKIQFEYLESIFLTSFYNKMINERNELTNKINRGELIYPENKIKGLELELAAYNEVIQFNKSIKYQNVIDFLEPKTRYEFISDKCFNHLKSVRKKIYEVERSIGNNHQKALESSFKERCLVHICINNLLYIYQQDPMEVEISIADSNSRKEGYQIVNKMVCTYNREKERSLIEGVDLYSAIRSSENTVRNVFPLVQATLMEHLIEYEDE